MILRSTKMSPDSHKENKANIWRFLESKSVTHHFRDSQIVIFMILLCNFKRIVLFNYLELEAEISTAKQSDIVFSLFVFGWTLRPLDRYGYRGIAVPPTQCPND